MTSFTTSVPLRLRELVEEGPAEGAEPALHAGLERGWARHQHDLPHGEAPAVEQRAIFLGRGEEPGRDQRRIAAQARRRRASPWRWPRHCHDRQARPRNGRAGFSARATPAMTRSGLRIQCSAALENTASNSETKSSAWPSSLRTAEPLHLGSRQQLVAQIDAEHVGAGRLDLGGQRAVAAAEIEDALARPWRRAWRIRDRPSPARSGRCFA